MPVRPNNSVQVGRFVGPAVADSDVGWSGFTSGPWGDTS